MKKTLVAALIAGVMGVPAHAATYLSGVLPLGSASQSPPGITVSGVPSFLDVFSFITAVPHELVATSFTSVNLPAVFLGINSPQLRLLDVTNPVSPITLESATGATASPFDSFALTPIILSSGHNYEFQVAGALLPGNTGVFAITTNGSAVTVPAVPEAPSWAFMLFGFAGLGLLAYRRREQSALA
jgi:MYXO-CTERM domain-containing protein